MLRSKLYLSLAFVIFLLIFIAIGVKMGEYVRMETKNSKK